MSKDRRLGRGLAALLGSPLDEHAMVEGAFGATSIAPSATEVASQQSRHVVSASSSNAPRPVRQSVTGAVPISSFGNASNAESTALVIDAPVNDSLSASPSLQLNVHEIQANPFQPRRKFNEEEIASLAASFKEHEQLQPILVRRVGDQYQLISGERRLRAAIHAGFETIRAEVREADDRLVAELAIVENLQRKDLDAIEKAMSFRRYLHEHKCTQDDLAKRLKIDRSTIANMMRLLELPDQVQEWIQAGTITPGHAKSLLPLGDEDQQLEFARLIQEEGWSVRETERRVNVALVAEDDASSPSATRYAPTRKRITPQVAQLEQQLRLALGTKTEIRQNSSGSGKITISFANNSEFERLCALICPELATRRAA